MTQHELKSSIQGFRNEIAGDGVTLTLCVVGGALLCIPFLGFLPLIAVCLGLVSVLATHRLLAEKVAELEKDADASDAN